MSDAGPSSISSWGLVLRNLRYYWVTNLAVIMMAERIFDRVYRH